MGRAPVHGLEVNPMATQPETQHQRFELPEFAVGNANPATDSGAAQSFAVHQDPNQVLWIDLGKTRHRQTQFFEHPFFIAGLQIDETRISLQHI